MARLSEDPGGTDDTPPDDDANGEAPARDSQQATEPSSTQDSGMERLRRAVGSRIPGGGGQEEPTSTGGEETPSGSPTSETPNGESGDPFQGAKDETRRSVGGSDQASDSSAGGSDDSFQDVKDETREDVATGEPPTSEEPTDTPEEPVGTPDTPNGFDSDGLENTDDGALGEQANELEQEFLEKNPDFDADDVKIVPTDDGKIRTEVSEQAQLGVAMDSITEQFDEEFQNTDLDTGDVEVFQTEDGGFSGTLTDSGIGKVEAAAKERVDTGLEGLGFEGTEETGFRAPEAAGVETFQEQQRDTAKTGLGIEGVDTGRETAPTSGEETFREQQIEEGLRGVGFEGTKDEGLRAPDAAGEETFREQQRDTAKVGIGVEGVDTGQETAPQSGIEGTADGAEGTRDFEDLDPYEKLSAGGSSDDPAPIEFYQTASGETKVGLFTRKGDKPSDYTEIDFGEALSQQFATPDKDILDDLTAGDNAGYLTEAEEEKYRGRSEEIREYYSVDDEAKAFVENLVGPGFTSELAGGVGNVPGKIISAVDDVYLLGDTAAETFENYEAVEEEYGAFAVQDAIGETFGAAGVGMAQSFKDNPGRFIGEVLGEAATGSIAFKGLEKSGDFARTARMSTDADVDLRDITTEKGARGELPKFETDPDAPTKQAVDEVAERAADQPSTVTQTGEFGVPEAVGFRIGETVGPRIQTVDDVLSTSFEDFKSSLPTTPTIGTGSIQEIGDAVTTIKTTAVDVGNRPLDAAEQVGVKAGTKVGQGLNAGSGVLEPTLGRAEDVGFKAGAATGQALNVGRGVADAPLGLAEDAGFRAGAATGRSINRITDVDVLDVSRPEFGGGLRSRAQDIDELVFGPAEALGRRAGRPVGKFLWDIEARRQDGGSPLSSVLYHGTRGKFDAEFDVGEGASELPGLFTSPEASPIALQGLGTGSLDLSSFKPRLPRLRGKDDRFLGLQGDDVRAMDDAAQGFGYELRDPDTGDQLLGGLGRGQAKKLADDAGDVEVAPDQTTSGFEFLDESAEAGAAFVRPPGSRSTELEAIFPPGSQFEKVGSLGVRVGRKQIPGTDVGVPLTGRTVPLDLFKRSGDVDTVSLDAGSVLEDMTEGEAASAASLASDIDRLSSPEGSLTTGGAVTGAGTGGATSAVGELGEYDPLDTGGLDESPGMESEPEFMASRTDSPRGSRTEDPALTTSIDVFDSPSDLFTPSSLNSVYEPTETTLLSDSPIPTGGGPTSGPGPTGSGTPPGSGGPPTDLDLPPTSFSPPGSSSRPPYGPGGSGYPPISEPNDPDRPLHPPIETLGGDKATSKKKKKRGLFREFTDVFTNPSIAPSEAVGYDPLEGGSSPGVDADLGGLDDSKASSFEGVEGDLDQL